MWRCTPESSRVLTVPPESLGTHIRQAINVGAARRESVTEPTSCMTDPAGLMRDMARDGIPVEISLSSVDLTFGARRASSDP